MDIEKPSFEDEPGLSAAEKGDLWDRAIAQLFGACGRRPNGPTLPIVPPIVTSGEENTAETMPNQSS